MGMQETVSWKGGGVSNEKGIENILDCMRILRANLSDMLYGGSYFRSFH